MAAFSSNSANIENESGKGESRLTDGHYTNCHVMVESSEEKKIYITMTATHEVYKIVIVGKPDKLDALVDFQIKVGKYHPAHDYFYKKMAVKWTKLSRPNDSFFSFK